MTQRENITAGKFYNLQNLQCTSLSLHYTKKQYIFMHIVFRAGKLETMHNRQSDVICLVECQWVLVTEHYDVNELNQYMLSPFKSHLCLTLTYHIGSVLYYATNALECSEWMAEALKHLLWSS